MNSKPSFDTSELFYSHSLFKERMHSLSFKGPFLSKLQKLEGKIHSLPSHHCWRSRRRGEMILNLWRDAEPLKSLMISTWGVFLFIFFFGRGHSQWNICSEHRWSICTDYIQNFILTLASSCDFVHMCIHSVCARSLCLCQQMLLSVCCSWDLVDLWLMKFRQCCWILIWKMKWDGCVCVCVRASESNEKD